MIIGRDEGDINQHQHRHICDTEHEQRGNGAHDVGTEQQTGEDAGVELKSNEAGDEIYVSHASTGLRTILPRYYAKGGILTVGPDELIKYRWGITIDNVLILDFDSERHLVGIELLIPRRKWSVEDLPEYRHSETTLRHGARSVPIRVLTNNNRSRVMIRIGHQEDDETEISMSKTCVGLVRKH